MFRIACVSAAVMAVFCSSAAGETAWYLRDVTGISGSGVQPSLWAGTVAYTEGIGGAVMYYQNGTSTLIYTPATANYEPANGNGSIGWRKYTSGTGINDIYRWDGTSITNVSNSSSADTNASAGSNGDLLWSRSHTWLWYYDASAGTATNLNVKGKYPSLYIDAGGVATYAYQDPDTDEVKYFDGTTTYTLGDGSMMGAFPSLWNGAVAWVTDREGEFFNTGEIFYWKDGVTVRVTDDDAVGGVADEGPTVWNDMVIWTRMPVDPTTPRLTLWAGAGLVELSPTGGRVPSFSGGQVAWVDSDGLYLATLAARGDYDADGDYDLADFAALQRCFTGADQGPAGAGCEAFTYDGDDDVDVADFVVFAEDFSGPAPL